MILICDTQPGRVNVLTGELTLAARSLPLILLMLAVFGDELEPLLPHLWRFLFVRTFDVEIHTLYAPRFHSTDDKLGNRNFSLKQLEPSSASKSRMALEEPAVALLLLLLLAPMVLQEPLKNATALSSTVDAR